MMDKSVIVIIQGHTLNAQMSPRGLYAADL